MRRNRMATPFGRQIKIVLFNQNMTNRDLAQKIGVSESTVCDVIFGRNNGERVRKKIARALDISCEELPVCQEKES